MSLTKAVVHGVVTALSPVKTSHKNSSVKYFDYYLRIIPTW